jgi:Domain of unknown function (DUF4124)
LVKVMGRPQLASTLILPILALLTSTVTAEIYKSVDANGNVVFSQQAPRDTKSEVIKPRNSKPPTAAAGTGPFVAPTQPGALPSATVTPPVAPPLTAEQIAAKQKNCDLAHQSLKDLQGPRANRLQYVNEQQQRAFLTPELLAARIKEAQDAVTKNCTADGAGSAPGP